MIGMMGIAVSCLDLMVMGLCLEIIYLCQYVKHIIWHCRRMTLLNCETTWFLFQLILKKLIACLARATNMHLRYVHVRTCTELIHHHRLISHVMYT